MFGRIVVRLSGTSDEEVVEEKEEKPMKNTPSPAEQNNRQEETLYARIIAFERRLHNKATFLDGKRCSTNDYTHWKARGSQETLWEVASSLRTMRRQYYSPFALHTALQDYLECLQTSQEDANWDVARLPRPQRGMPPIVQWKAEGEALVLSKLCPELEDILNEYTMVDNALSTIVLNQPVLVAG
jgi:hypothetical protein